jgi:hypothetical protein
VVGATLCPEAAMRLFRESEHGLLWGCFRTLFECQLRTRALPGRHNPCQVTPMRL